MIYFLVLVAALAVAVLGVWHINRMNTSSGDGELGYAMMLLIGEAVVVVTDLCMWATDFVADSPWLGIPVAIVVLYVLKTRATR